MKTIEMLISEKQIIAPEETIVTWNEGYKFSFNFDEEWDDTKTLRILSDKWKVIQEKVFFGDSVEIDSVKDTNYIAIGVYSGNGKSTIPLILQCENSILEYGGSPEPSSEDVYLQILSEMNNRAKTDLSNVSNEDFKTKAELSGVGSGEAELFIINASLDLSTNDFTIGDTTFNDIQDAYNEGKTVFANVKDTTGEITMTVPLLRVVKDYCAVFFAIGQPSGNGLTDLSFIIINFDNTFEILTNNYISEERCTNDKDDVAGGKADRIPACNAVRDYVQNEIAEANNVFVVHATLTSDTTAVIEENYDDLKEAVESEKQIIIRLGGLLFSAWNVENNGAYIAAVYGNSYHTYSANVYPDGTVAFSMTSIAYSIYEENATVDKITTEFAVVDYVQGKIGDIETALDNIIALQSSLIGGETA